MRRGETWLVNLDPTVGAEILLKLQVLLAAYANDASEERRTYFAKKYLMTKHTYLQLAYGMQNKSKNTFKRS